MDPTQHQPIAVMLVDDDRAARRGFMMSLSSVPGIVVTSQASNGEEALRFLEDNPRAVPDVILMDVRMPVMDGIEATAVIKERFPQIRVLILTTYDEDDYAFDALARGASGFLLKDVEPEALRAAVRAVYHGDSVLTPRLTAEVIRRSMRVIANADRVRDLRERFDQLSRREREVAELVAQGMTNQEIADRLVLEPASVRRTVSRVLSRMHMRDRIEVVIAWHHSGLDQL